MGNFLILQISTTYIRLATFRLCNIQETFEEHYITVIRDMYERTKTKVRTLTGSTKEFHIDVGLHQGSALIPFLFIVILDVLTESIGTDPPNAKLFAGDIVICEYT